MSSLKKAAQVAIEKCISLKPHEKILIVYDNPQKEIALSLLNHSKKISSQSMLLKINSPKLNGEEPEESVANSLLNQDVIMLVTSKSLSHTKARRRATEQGCRIASMPGITKDTFIRTMDADYGVIQNLTNKLAEILTNGKIAKITTQLGTNIIMNIEGRISNKGALIREKKDFNNLPSGEACLGPIEGTTNGVLIVDASFLEKVDQPITLKIENGFVIDIKGGLIAKKVKKVLDSVNSKNAYAIAELGIGTHHKAKITGNILEDEKVLGTAHIALGNNLSYGGHIDVPIHLDGVFLNPTIHIDDKKIIENGKLLI